MYRGRFAEGWGGQAHGDSYRKRTGEERTLRKVRGGTATQVFGEWKFKPNSIWTISLRV